MFVNATRMISPRNPIRSKETIQKEPAQKSNEACTVVTFKSSVQDVGDVSVLFRDNDIAEEYKEWEVGFLSSSE